MKKEAWVIVFMLHAILFSPLTFAGQEKDEPERDGKFDTASKVLKGQYQSVNASIFAGMINPGEYKGPFAGPGFYSGMNGPLVSIFWINRDKNGQAEVTAERHIPIGSILSVDLPMLIDKEPKRYVAYYKGPFGETEFFILIDGKSEKEEASTYERFIKRWKLFLLSQEPTR